MRTRVAIVNAGHWGNLREGDDDYTSLVEKLEESLKKAKRTDDQPAADVRVVRSTDEALAWLYNRDVIIYISRGMTDEAKKVAAEHPRIRVILFTGLVPDGEVIFVSKTWVYSSEQIRNVVLFG
ncbi:hypothetical protein HY374_03620 [Candidatus Berkelbacteria bacterium]|nr:hypothetical protein [Candidatus Berkelbacteria bacterium]